ncbi:MAG TPA: hypothetical protein VF765_33830 [Polyangiaceae bacterium]
MSAPGRLAALGTFAAVLAGSPVVRAQGAESPTARADRLFREGKAALEAGRFDEACPKLAESQRLDPGAGTLLALALCDEGRGHTATAWREFGDVATESEKTNRADRVAMSRQHQKALEGRLSHLEVDVASGAGLTVRVDGAELPASSWGKPVAVDPGDHAVDAEGQRAQPWHATVHVGPDRDTKIVSVPVLGAVAEPPEASPSAEPEPKPEPSSDERGDQTRTIGWIVGGAGVAALGVGAVFGALALGSHGSATNLCPSSPCTSATGVDDENRAKTQAWIADVGIGIGVAAVAVGAYLVFVRPHGASPATATITPIVGPDVGGLALHAAW